MILNVSSRTDIIGFYTKWFMNRFHEGFIDVRNPFFEKNVSRIYFSDVDAIYFCTKNPIPILPYIGEFNIPIIFHVTLTPYKRNIEPYVPPKGKVILAVKKLSKILGKDKVVVRYDPIFISEEYDISYHIKNFEKLCFMLKGYITKIIVSFMDEYKNVKKNKNVIKNKIFSEDDYKKIGISFSKIAHKYNILVQTCFEDRNLLEYGFDKGECLSRELAFKLTGKIYECNNSRKGKKCKCAKMVDIGSYNSCLHYCKYCYANFDEKLIKNNYKNHDPSSSLLLGHLNENDIIKVRKK